jgi:3-phenylpropionate/trans-cinnamate dioxygenase ferredoxin component
VAWQRVASVADLEPDTPLPVTVAGKSLAIYRLGEEFYALDDICPHEFALLSAGYIDGDRIECPLHQAQFEIRTGKCMGPPAEADIATYPVNIEGDDIMVDLP